MHLILGDFPLIFNKKVGKKMSAYVIWNDKFRKLLTPQITTAVDPNVAEYKFLQELLLLNKRTIFKLEQESQENCQSVLYPPPLFGISTGSD